MTCVIALFVMLTFSVFAYSNEPLNAGSEIINVIKLFEIANGDENGNMNYDKEVTRAEFVKMAINASTNKEAAANIKLNISLFPDVKNSYWGSGYISVAVNNGLVTGYSDGTFKPNNAVTLEEAVTIVLRLLVVYTSLSLMEYSPYVPILVREEGSSTLVIDVLIKAVSSISRVPSFSVSISRCVPLNEPSGITLTLPSISTSSSLWQYAKLYLSTTVMYSLPNSMLLQ